MTSDFIPVNVYLVRLLGQDAALMFARLYEEYQYQKSVRKMSNDYFSCSVLRVKNSTGLSKEKKIKKDLLQKYPQHKAS